MLSMSLTISLTYTREWWTLYHFNGKIYHQIFAWNLMNIQNKKNKYYLSANPGCKNKKNRTDHLHTIESMKIEVIWTLHRTVIRRSLFWIAKKAFNLTRIDRASHTAQINTHFSRSIKSSDWPKLKEKLSSRFHTAF